MIHLNDTTKKIVGDNRYVTLYRATCDGCGKDRGYIPKQRATNCKYCTSCAHKFVSDSTRQKMSDAKQGKPAWNRGKVGVSAGARLKMSSAKVGKSPHNKGKRVDFETRVKLSCINQGISREDFTDFKSPEQRRERNRFADMGLHLDCFDRSEYRCEICGADKVVLNAHHKNSWAFFPDQRFDISNLISLCRTCHREFHSIYGNGKSVANTEKQLEDFKKNRSFKAKKVILVTGVSGAGKSWVCQQLKDRMHYVSYDDDCKRDIRSYLWSLDCKVVLYDPFSHVSTFIKRNGDIFEIELNVILESRSVIEQRLLSRGGTITPSIVKRMKRMEKLASIASFSGTSEEVLDHLKHL